LPRYLLTDQTRLRQILFNLLGNAVKFTPRDGTIVLRVGAEVEADGRVRLGAEVEDTGPGIAAADLPAMFKPFFQTSAGKQAGGGTGLGLAISREFARLLDGDLMVSSQWGVGSTFRLAIRASSSDAVAAQSTPDRRVVHLVPGQAACRVLIVDDEPDNRDLLEQMLTPIGFETRTAVDGAEAIALGDAWRPHVVLLDLRMPGVDGYEAARQIRAAHGASLKIIALSAMAFPEDREAAMAAGADAFLPKPFLEADLLERLKQLTRAEYLYAPSSAPSDQAPAATAEDLPSAAAIERLPIPFRDALRHALAVADYVEMLALAAEAAVEEPLLGRQLRQLVERYDYEALHTLLNSDRTDA
jgi:CheY-like chemotaxis protein